jgi:hypothetical protein
VEQNATITPTRTGERACQGRALVLVVVVRSGRVPNLDVGAPHLGESGNARSAPMVGTQPLTHHGPARSTKHGSTQDGNKGTIPATAARCRSGLNRASFLPPEDAVVDDLTQSAGC